MQKIDEYRKQARSLGKERFIAEHSTPVFVPQQILAGSIARSRSKLRNATMVHHDSSAVVNPLSSRRAMSIENNQFGGSLADGLLIGRDAGCSVTIADYTISKHHALWRPGKFPKPATLEDIGSSNGTWINGTKLEKSVPTSLSSGDTVRLGRIVLFYLSPRDFYDRLMSNQV